MSTSGDSDNTPAESSSVAELGLASEKSRAAGEGGGGDRSTLKIQVSTMGKCHFDPPNIEGLELGFDLPRTPGTLDEAREYVKTLLRQGGLPSRDSYQEAFGGLRQNRLLFRLLSDLQACLALWTIENSEAATYFDKGRSYARYQIGPLPVCFSSPKRRRNSFASWHSALPAEVQDTDEVRDFMAEEFKAYHTIEEAAFNHRSNATNMYLCSTQDHPSYGQSFGVLPWRDVDEEEYKRRMADEEAREAHSGRNGIGHEFVVLIDDAHRAYVYDPSFDPAGWADVEKDKMRLGNARFLKRADELLKHLAGGKERKLERVVVVGGGGNESDTCRTMSVRWFVERVAQWMDIRPREPSEFAEDAEVVRLRR